MDTILPNNWVKANLGDILKLKNGYAFKSKDYLDNGVPVIRMSDIVDGEITLKKAIRVEEKTEYDNFIINKGDILIGMSGSIGKYGIFNLDKKVYLNQRVGNLKLFSDVLINKKLVYYLIGHVQKQIVDQAYGGTIPNISGKQLESTKIGLAPLKEQQRIVLKLDNLFSQLDDVKLRLERIPSLLKNFKQTILSKALNGDLTEKWRFSNNSEKWKNYLLNELCLSITDGDHQAPPKSETGVPFLVISNISKGFFDFNSVTRFVPRSYFNAIKHTRIPKKGDVLYTVTGSYGIPLFVDFQKDFCFQRHIAILKPDNSKIISKFLFYVLSSFELLEQANNVATGTAQKTVPLRGIKNFSLKLPKIEEQIEIVKQIDSLFEKSDLIEKQYNILKEKIDTLPQSILHKAFKGELVEQLTGDGDARELLVQIKKLKEEMNKKGKKKK